MVKYDAAKFKEYVIKREIEENFSVCDDYSNDYKQMMATSNFSLLHYTALINYLGEYLTMDEEE